MLKAAIEQHFASDYRPFYTRYLEALKPGTRDTLKTWCPFHEGNSPALSIDFRTGLFHCHACDAKGDVFNFYAMRKGLSLPAEFPKALAGIAQDFGIGNGTAAAEKRIVAEYSYHDEAGRLVYQKVRYEPKGFRLRRPDGKGGWTWDLKGATLVPYGLRESMAAPEILFVEGEKDVDNLRRLGFAATCGPHGSGQWPDHFGPLFAGKAAILIADNDEPGRKHMKMVAANLKPHASSIRWVDLPATKTGYDVSDFIAEDPEAAVERLSGLMAEAKEYQEEAPEVKAGPTLIDGIIGAEDFARLDLPAPTTYLDPIVTGRKIILISGYRGVGKTWAGLSIADSITRGIAWGPWEAVTPAACFYLDGEMACQDIQARIRGLNPAGERRAPLLLYSDAYASTLGLPRASILNPQWRAEIQKILLDLGVKVFVIDNLSSLTGGLDENSKQEWDPVNQWLISLRFAGITSIMLHHVGKGGQQRGTSGREDNIDLSIVLKQPADYEADQGADFTLSVTKSRVGIDDLGKLRDVHFTLGADAGGVLTWTWQWAKSEKRSEILALLDAGESVTDIAALVGVSKPYVSKVNRERKR